MLHLRFLFHLHGNSFLEGVNLCSEVFDTVHSLHFEKLSSLLVDIDTFRIQKVYSKQFSETIH